MRGLIPRCCRPECGQSPEQPIEYRVRVASQPRSAGSLPNRQSSQLQPDSKREEVSDDEPILASRGEFPKIPKAVQDEVVRPDRAYLPNRNAYLMPYLGLS